MRRKFRVLQIIGGGEIAGSKNQFLALCRKQMEKGYFLRIICFIEGELARDARAMDIPIQILEMSNIIDWRVIPPLRQLIINDGFELVHTHGVRANFVGRIAARKTPAKIITTIYSFPKEDYKNILKRTFYPPIDRLTTGLADRLIVVSQGLKNKLLAVNYAPSEKIRVIPCSIDMESSKPTKSAEETRKELGIPLNSPACGMLARLVYVKNPFLFLDVAEIVQKVMPQAYFLFIGDGPYLIPLQREVEKRGLHIVKFTGYRQDPLDLINALDVVALTSISEGLPVTLLEASALGKPVVATRVGGVPEVVQDGLTGYLVPSGDAQAFAQRLIYLFQNKEEALKMGENGKAWIKETFSLEKMVEETEKVYREVLEDETS